jgi:hypothetical protein
MGSSLRRTLRQKPHLRIEKHGDSLDFIFKFEGSVTRALREEQPRLYDILFRQKESKYWPHVLKLAYHSKASGPDGKTVKQWLRLWLNRIFINAFDVLLSKAISENLSKDDRDYVEKEIAFHKTLLKRKHGPPISQRRQEQDAIRFAQIHLQLMPQVKMLRAFVSRQKADDNKALGQTVENEFRFEWVHCVTRGTALQHLPTIDGDLTTSKSQLNGSWTARQLSVGIIYCKEEALKGRVRLQPSTIYRYINKGNVLLKKITPAPKPA